MWLYGDVNSGKSSYINKMEEERGARIYRAPYNNDWIGFEPAYHNFIVFD